jgi:Major Facilitator Superfamily
VLALLAVDGPGQVWLIDAVMFAYGLSYGVLGPAQSALLTVMVPAELLPDANAALRTAQELLRLIGPLAGAGLLLLRVREPAPRPMAGRWVSQVTAGIRHIWHTIELRHVIVAGACTTTVFGFGETLTYAIASNGLHRSTAFVGVLGAVQGAGAIAGGLSAAALVRRLGEGRLIGMAMLIAAAGAALQAPPLLPSVLAGDIIFGMAIPWLVVGLITLAQRLTPSERQGRVYAAAETLITTPQTLSIALGAALITVTGYQVLLLAMAITTALAAIYLLTRPELRQAARQRAVSQVLTAGMAKGGQLRYDRPAASAEASAVRDIPVERITRSWTWPVRTGPSMRSVTPAGCPSPAGISHAWYRPTVILRAPCGILGSPPAPGAVGLKGGVSSRTMQRPDESAAAAADGPACW